MNKQVRISIIMSICIVGMLFSSFLPFFYHKSLDNASDDDVDLNSLLSQAIHYDNLFQIKCNDENTLSGSEVVCNVSINPNLENFDTMGDILKYVSFRYELGDFISLEEISLKSRNGGKPYEGFSLDISKKNTVILKNTYYDDSYCNFDGDCRISGRSFSKFAGELKEVANDSIENVWFQFKFKISEKASYSEPLNFRIYDLFYYSEKDEDTDVKNSYKMDNLNYSIFVNQLQSDSSFLIFKDGFYKVKISKGTFVYVNSSLKNIGGKFDDDVILDVYYDWINPIEGKSIDSFSFNDYRERYCFLVKFDGKVGYVKYSDVEIVSDSIHYKKNEKSNKYYVYEDEYLYNGPGVSFQDYKVKVPKGTILSTDTYINSGNAIWLYVEYLGNKGWLLESCYNSVNYPYNNVVYGNTNEIVEESGSFNVGNNSVTIYKYPFSNEGIVDISKNDSVNYDYYTSLPGIDYYHVSYNGVDGFITVIKSYCKDKKNDGNLYVDYYSQAGKRLVC